MSLPSPSIFHQNLDSQEMDELLIVLAQKCNGDLRLLFYSFFGFLHRRTDFYYIRHPRDKEYMKENLHKNQKCDASSLKMGFQEGDAEKLLHAAFRQFPLRRMPPLEELEKKEIVKVEGESGTSNDVKRIIETKQMNNNLCKKGDHKLNQDFTKVEISEVGVDCESNDPKIDAKDMRKNPTGTQISSRNYEWIQSLNDVSMAILLPSNTRSRDLKVQLNNKCILIKYEPSNLHIIEGHFTNLVRSDESTWLIEKNVLLIILEKKKNDWWNKVFTHEEENKEAELLEKRHNFCDSDAATQGMIRNILNDESDKILDLLSTNEVLAKDT